MLLKLLAITENIKQVHLCFIIKPRGSVLTETKREDYEEK